MTRATLHVALEAMAARGAGPRADGREIDDSLAVGEVALLVGRIHLRGRDSGVEARSSRLGAQGPRREGLYLRAFREPKKVIGKI